MSDFAELVEDQRDRAADVAFSALTEVWGVIPWGHEFLLPNGVRARLVEINGNAGKSRPKMHDGRARMIFDVQMENGRLDHVEFTIQHTGQGGMA